MDAEEIMNWTAYELSCDPEYIKTLNAKDVVCNSPEQEADEIRKMLMSLGQQQ